MKDDGLEERLARVETVLAHHQRDYDALNSVVTEQANLIDRMRHQLERMAQRVEILHQAQGESMPRSLEDDRPPHY